MRRLLLFAALLSLLGLSTAFAATVAVQSEDVTSYTTDVSISVPSAALRTLYLSGEASTRPGLLAEVPPVDTSVNSRSIERGTGSVQSQTDPERYHSWQTAPVSGTSLNLAGPAVLRAFQNGSIAPLTVGLFSCPPTALPDSTGCTQIGTDQSGAAPGGATEVMISIAFGSASIPVGHHLRVQVMDLSNQNWNIQWGYKTNRESRLEINVVSP